MNATVEEAVERAVARFHREEQGHTPEVYGVTILPDMVIVRSRDVFTSTERELVETEAGRKIVQSARREQRATNRRMADAAIAAATGRVVLRSFYDLDVRVGEQVEVYVFG